MIQLSENNIAICSCRYLLLEKMQVKGFYRDICVMKRSNQSSRFLKRFQSTFLLWSFRRNWDDKQKFQHNFYHLVEQFRTLEHDICCLIRSRVCKLLVEHLKRYTKEVNVMFWVFPVFPMYAAGYNLWFQSFIYNCSLLFYSLFHFRQSSINQLVILNREVLLYKHRLKCCGSSWETF